MTMKFDKFVVVASLLAAAACLAFGVYGNSSRWVSSAGLLCDLAGIYQLSTSEFFSALVERYQNAERIPSYVTRRIIDSPDQPVSTYLRNTLSFDAQTGFRLIVLGTVLQLVGTWLPTSF